MESNYTPIDSSFRQEVERLAAQKKYVSINYITDLRELLTTTAVIKEIYSESQVDYVRLSTDEEIRLDRIVRVGDTISPGYSGYDFSNSCSL